MAGMQISISSSSGSTANANSAATIARLQKQMRELTEQLKAVVWEDMDPKAKEQRIQMLQAMIQMVQQQIAATQQAEEMQQMQRQAAEQRKVAQASTKRASGLVDVYA